MKVAVVIPCWNVEQLVARCIDSVLQQEVDAEIICVDDGSTDNTLQVLRSYEAKYPDIIRVLTRKNGGASAARNLGWNMSSAGLIQFLDADDHLLPGKLKHQLDLVNVGNVDFVAGAYTRVYSNGTKELISVSHDAWNGLILGRLGCTCSNLFSRTILQRIGGWNEQMKSSQEAELMFRMLSAHAKVLVDDAPLTQVNVRQQGSVSASDPVGNLERYVRLRKSISDHLTKENLLTEGRKRSLSAMIFGALSMIYKVDRSKAVELYETLFRKHIAPVSVAPIGRIKAILYRIIGFNRTERLFLLRGK